MKHPKGPTFNDRRQRIIRQVLVWFLFTQVVLVGLAISTLTQ